MAQAKRDHSTVASKSDTRATTPAATRFAEWQDATTRANDPRISDTECAAHVEVAHRAANRLARTRARRPADTALKLRVFKHESASGSSSVTERLSRSLAVDLDRLASAA